MRAKLRCGWLLGVALVVSCGSSASNPIDASTITTAGFAGNWRGTLSAGLLGKDLQVDVSLTPVGAGDQVLDGTMTLNAPECFKNASAIAEVSKTSLTGLNAIGSGTMSQSTSVTITGELAADKITGVFSMISLTNACSLDPTAITLNRL